MKLIALLNPRSGVILGLPSGFSGSLPWKINITKAYTNHNELMVSIAFRNSFQFIFFVGSIPQKRKISRSTGLRKSVIVRSPLNTFAMYFPRGKASTNGQQET